MKIRREFLQESVCTAAGMAIAAALASPPATAAAAAPRSGTPEEIARDEKFWSEYRRNFSPDPARIWFNCLAFNPSARKTHEAFLGHERRTNTWPLSQRGAAWGKEKQAALRARLARMINATADEVAFARNTTEALANVTFGLPLAAGDEVLITTQDYQPITNAWRQRAARDRIVVRAIEIPAAVTAPAEIVAAFRKAITPSTKAVMFPHISDTTGLIFPARAIADLVHEHGAQVIVDGALSFGVVPVDVNAIDCDYYATSLHKGVFAPTGTGFLYVRRSRIRALWPLFGAPEAQADNIRKFENRGTAPVGAWAVVDDALDLHESIGIETFAARYRHLTKTWTERVRDVPGVRMNTPSDPALSCGITNVDLEGIDPKKLYQYLFDKERISTWPIQDPGYAGLWISPYPFTTKAELEKLTRALVEVRKRGLPA